MHTNILEHSHPGSPHILARMTDSSAASEPDQSNDGASAAPILIALGIVGFVLIAMVVFRMIGNDNVSDDNGIGRAVIAQNDALQREDYTAFRAYTCAPDQGTQAEVISGQQHSKAARGPRFVQDVTDVKVDGDRATATVVYYFEKAKDAHVTAPTTFVKADGGWKVCSIGPR